MENQFALWIAIMFGFTSCTMTEEEQFETDLVGTWIEVRTTHSTDGNDEWVSTERKTIILERVNDRLRFRNCIDDTHATATVLDEQVTLSGDDYPALELSDDDTLTGVTAIDGAEVVLQRVSAEINTVQAELELTEPQPMNTWTELCLQTLVSDSGENHLAFKATNDFVGVMVGMTFVFDAPIASDQYDFSNAIDTQTATGVYELPDEEAPVTGTLSEPVGTLIVTANDNIPWDFQADLTLQDSNTDGEIDVAGLLQVDSEWFNPE